MNRLIAQRITNPLAPKLVPESPEASEGLFSSLLQSFITVALIVAVIAFFFVFILGGIQWITSGGDKAKTEAARGKLTNAVIGLVLVFALWVVLGILESLFGIDLINIDLTDLVIGGS